MILLMVLMVVMAVNSLTLKGAMKGLKFYLVPDFSKFSEIGFPHCAFSPL